MGKASVDSLPSGSHPSSPISKNGPPRPFDRERRERSLTDKLNVHESGSLAANPPLTCPFSNATSLPLQVHEEPQEYINTKTLPPDSLLLAPVSEDIHHQPEEDHKYRAPQMGQSRGPCPALNALANHGYLPRDGKDITYGKIVHAMKAGMGLSTSFALFMATGTFLLMRRFTLEPFDLEETAHHGYIEHNASITRDDTPSDQQFAPLRIDHGRLNNFLEKAHVTPTSNGQRVITQEDVADERIEVEKKSPRLSPFYAEIARAEFAMVLEIFGTIKSKEVYEKDCQTLLGEERFPDGWRPTHVLRLWDAVKRSSNIRKIMERREHQSVEHAALRTDKNDLNDHKGFIALVLEWLKPWRHEDVPESAKSGSEEKNEAPNS